MPKLIETMLYEEGEKSAAAAKRISELCNDKNAENRVPLVCSGQYDVLVPLAKCLIRDNADEHQLAWFARHIFNNYPIPTERRSLRHEANATLWACVALTNLSIPTENRWVMALGPESEIIIGTLSKLIAQDKEESYFGCMCLNNLSLLEACSTTIMQHSPVSKGQKSKAPLDNEASLLRILEKILNNFISPLKSTPFESKAAQWACGLIKNLAKNGENAALIGRTDIPKCVTEIIRAATAPPVNWTTNIVKQLSPIVVFDWASNLIKKNARSDENANLIRGIDSQKRMTGTTLAATAPLFNIKSNSIEDFSLFVILHLSQWPETHEALHKAGALEVIQPLMLCGKLQGLKATMACAFLGAEWSAFPGGGIPASEAVAELMVNIVEKKDKADEYVHTVFKLSTATKAYCALSRAAWKADKGSGEFTKVLAVPSALALHLRIISDLIASAMEDADAGGTKNNAPDSVSAEPAHDPIVPDIVREIMDQHQSSTFGHDRGTKCTDDAVSSAEYAIGTIHALLPGILHVVEPPGCNALPTKKAWSEISTMLLTYVKICNPCSSAQVQAKDAAEKIAGAAAIGKSYPILETSHYLWTQYRRCDGQPLDQFNLTHFDHISDNV
ncbi:hypothetical protein MHU86_13013 [Fragilaria crotonensis]|nr:hypothetical protein MHU86_13013 [Fragilaria crotonensis]